MVKLYRLADKLDKQKNVLLELESILSMTNRESDIAKIYFYEGYHNDFERICKENNLEIVAEELYQKEGEFEKAGKMMYRNNFAQSENSTKLNTTDKKSRLKKLCCPDCEYENEEGAKFCSRCGNKLLNNCLKCGKDLKPEDLFCSKCGTRVSDSQ